MSELEELQQLVWQTEQSPARVALLEQACQLADSANDPVSGFDLRQQLVHTAMFTGFPEKVLVAFSWNLAQVDTHPEQFSEVSLLWNYKWVITCLYEFPQISLKQMEDALADLAQRFERHGATKRPIHTLRCKIAWQMGDAETVQATLPLWKKASSGYLSDCGACDRDSLLEMQLFLGQNKRALQTAQPILSGRMSCAEVPHVTYSKVLIPLLQLGRPEEAAEYHQSGYRLVKDNFEFVPQQAEHLIYKVVTGDTAGAVKVFERHLRIALDTHSPYRQLFFYRAALLLMRHLRQKPKSSRKLRLPEAFPLWQQSGVYDVGELADWFDAGARALAERFDTRSGNHYRIGEIDDLADLEAMIAP